MSEQDKWIEKWLLNRLGESNRFEQFNRQFCKDLINDYIKQHYEQKRLDRPELREKIFEIVDGANFKQGPTSEEATAQILALLISDIEEAKKQIAYDLFEEIICPMCYRLNPQHATMDNGKGCHYCQEREDWQALKEEK